MACPATKVVMLTVSEDEDDLLSAMKSGAKGYVLKGVSASELGAVIRAVNAGEVYVAPALAWGLLREMSKPRTADPLEELSGRERQVLELVAGGLSNQKIGLKLGLAEKTIKHYMTNILTSKAGDAACGPEHQPWAAQCHRRADHQLAWLRNQPENSQTGGGDLRLDENRGRLPQDPLPPSGARGRRLPGRAAYNLVRLARLAMLATSV
jgi:CheY-like chemotaxis protein